MSINGNVLSNLPSVLAFRRGVIISDALLEYENNKGEILPVPVFLHGTMGTQNVNEKKAKKKNTNEESTVIDADRDVRNLQIVESAKTGSDMENLKVSFQIKALSLDDLLHSCANSKKENIQDAQKFRMSLEYFILNCSESEGLLEVSRRIARNICNGRWLWRNRFIASSIKISISTNEKTFEVPNAFNVSIKDFNDYTDVEKNIANLLCLGFKGENKTALKVSATLDLGVKGSVEVFCSQNYEPDTGRSNAKNELSRSLYKLPIEDTSLINQEGLKVVGQAAFRDAKIWNALRTIDTWYPDYDENYDFPAPIEPQGASLSLMRFLRAKENKKFSSFELFKKLETIDPDSPEGMYCIASLIRGGVFGDSEKNRNEEGDD